MTDKMTPWVVNVPTTDVLITSGERMARSYAPKGPHDYDKNKHLIGTHWMHTGRGTTYTIVGVCQIESTWRPGFRYLAHTDGMEIIRDQEEFLDGRFVQIEWRGDV